MYKICLNKKTEKQLKELLAEETNLKVWKRLKAIHLRKKQVPSREISQTLDVSLDTVTNWVKLFLSEGLKGLVHLRYESQGIKSSLSPYQESIRQLTKEVQIPTLSVLQSEIANRFGVEIGETGLYKWCKKNSICLSRRPD